MKRKKGIYRLSAQHFLVKHIRKLLIRTAFDQLVHHCRVIQNTAKQFIHALQIRFVLLFNTKQTDKLNTLILPIYRFFERTDGPKRCFCLRNERVRDATRLPKHVGDMSSLSKMESMILHRHSRIRPLFALKIESLLLLSADPYGKKRVLF